MLRNKKHLSALQKEGFATFPFLKKEQIGQLCDLFAKYEDFHNANVSLGKFYHSTFHVEKEELSRQINTGIYNIIKNSIDEHFENYSLFVSNFLIKESVQQSELPPHQDWTFVDETQYQSINIWIPLQDVDTKNGCLTFLPGSHSVLYSHRTSPYYPSIFENVMPLVKDKMIPVPAKVGEAVVFYNSTLHGSTPNNWGQRRIVAVQGIYSQGAQLQHLFLDKETGKVSQYDISVEDFLKMEDLKRPAFLNPVREFQPKFPQLTKEQFLEYYSDSTMQKAMRWIKQLLK